jgi:predicted SnoaL-like aldol condensation-catalyzing enzyme
MTDDPKAIATQFLQLAAAGKACSDAAALITETVRHHNVHFAGDGASLLAAMDANAVQFPDKRLDVQRVLRDGDLVAIHSRVTHTPDDPGFALVHLFRFEGGAIAELWDIAQPVPPDSPNKNGMF